MPPTTTRPGSPEKVEVLAQRLEAGEPLWHPDDKIGEQADQSSVPLIPEPGHVPKKPPVVVDTGIRHSGRRFEVRITIWDIPIHLGKFDTEAEAKAARSAAEKVAEKLRDVARERLGVSEAPCSQGQGNMIR